MKFRSLFVLLALTALISGCQSSTSLRSAWFDTDFAGPPIRKILVVGDLGTAADDRLFEDTMAEKLRQAGVDAIAGHTLRLNDPATPDASFVSAVTSSGAQGLLLVRLLGVDTRTEVTTTMVQGGMGWGRGPWGSSPHMWVPAHQITRYDLATVETKLYDVLSKQLVWAATTSTLNPRSVARDTPGFADLIVGQLADRKIIGAQ